MATFKALTSRGLIDVLYSELESLGYKKLEKDSTGVSFESNWEGCYLANLKLRTATRVVLPILDFPAYQPEDLYHNTLKHDFTKYIDPNQTLSVNATVRESSFHDQRFVGMKIKDAIVDQFREKFSIRPDVDGRNPHLRLLVRVVKNQVSMSIDTSGDALSFRGYRLEGGRAPMKEHLAAGLLMLAEWTPDKVLVDPMCGSGTILIEAALMAKNIAPGSFRKEFAFQKLKGFQADRWQALVSQVLDEETPDVEVKLYGSDMDFKAIQLSKANAARAGVDEFIEFQKSGVDVLEAPAETGLIVVNPPYGERLEVNDFDRDAYKDLSFIFKKNFKTWTAWILSGNEELTRDLKLKTSRRIPVYNGPIECRFLRYEIR